MRPALLLLPPLFVAACVDSSTHTGLKNNVPIEASRVADVLPTDPVLQWNRELLRIVRTPGAQPSTIHPTRSFAMMHAAIYDAVNSIDRRHRAYAVLLDGVSRHASKEAAAASAAHDVLVELYPLQHTALDDQLRTSLGAVPDGKEKRDGVGVGQAVAARIVALRANDGSATPPIPFAFDTTPGRYRSTPPNFPAQPQFTHWSHVRPFTLRKANQFRPAPPPPLASDTYEDAFNEVKALGQANGVVASADEALTGRFWNGAIQNYWNEIAQTLSVERHLDIVDNARLFASLNLGVADVVIAFYDAKYTYDFWRPVTAIRAANTDDNAGTIADSAWLPVVGNTTPDPSYPGAHAAISAVASQILEALLGTDRLSFAVTSEVMPGTERSFSTLSSAAREATLSRIFAGVHFRFDLTTGESLGRRVSQWVLDRFLKSAHQRDSR